jgi:hypothetical protein
MPKQKQDTEEPNELSAKFRKELLERIRKIDPALITELTMATSSRRGDVADKPDSFRDIFSRGSTFIDKWNKAD